LTQGGTALAPDGRRVDEALGYRPGLDGLRGVAVLAVLAFHGNAGADGGALGVDLFLVLSGFLITTLLLADLSGPSQRVDLGRFWARRARRLLPAMLTVVLAVVAAVALRPSLAAGYPAQQLRGDALATLAYVPNWRYAFSGHDYFAAFAAPSPLLHAWSLAVEEQWYLFWPLGLWLLWRVTRRQAWLMVGGISALAVASAAVMWLLSDDLDRVHYGTDTRAQGLLVGAALAVVVQRCAVASWSPRVTTAVQVAGWAGAGLTLWMIVTVGGTTPWLYRGGHLLFAVAAAALLAAALVPGAVLTRLLSLRALRAVGLISYGLYLWHWPLFIWISPDRTGLDRWPLFAVRVAVSVAVATGSYWLIEQPIRLQRRPIARPMRVGLAATAVAAVAVIAISAPAVRSDGDDFAVAVPELPAGFEAHGSSEPGAPVPARLPGPTTPPDDGTFDVDIVGDSVGFSLFWQAQHPAEIPDGSGTGFRLNNGSLLGCGLDSASVVVDGQPVVLSGEGVPCADALDVWVHFVRDTTPDVVLVTLGAWEVLDRELDDGTRLDVGSPEWGRWLMDRLQTVVGRLAEVAPQASFAILDVPCYDQQELTPGGSESDRNEPTRVAAVNDVLHDFAARNPERVQVLPMSEWVCPGGDPRRELDGFTLRPDGVHVSGPATTHFWQEMLLPELVARFRPSSQ
jgi:peptidoglycan/LPS O-acetylase OafA/YrhL